MVNIEHIIYDNKSQFTSIFRSITSFTQLLILKNVFIYSMHEIFSPGNDIQPRIYSIMELFARKRNWNNKMDVLNHVLLIFAIFYSFITTYLSYKIYESLVVLDMGCLFY